VSKFFRRLFSLLKGYRFSEEDIMSHLLDQVFTGLEGEVIEILGLSIHLEYYLRGLAFREVCQEKGLSVCLPELVPADAEHQPRRLVDLFNPWLLTGQSRVVPCTLEQGEARVTTIVTGPNSGGKTRLMQSLAVTQLLAQGGMFVPAAEARLPAVEHLFLSLLEHADASQAEGRLGLELLRIREVFESSGPSALVIMDELCSGTNPSEGERIFEMVLGLFEELEPQVLITTHFLDFAAALQKKNGTKLQFLQVEIGERDVPTYQFVPGVASTSLARNTAARLGVTREELLGLIEAHKLRRQQRD
jgi:DNA mismatch repair protein MutS2